MASRVTDRFTAPPLLKNDPFVQRCLLEINEGKVYTISEIAEKIKAEREFVRRLFCKEPGVVKINSEYRVPHCVFERVMLRSMKPPQP